MTLYSAFVRDRKVSRLTDIFYKTAILFCTIKTYIYYRPGLFSESYTALYSYGAPFEVQKTEVPGSP